MWVNEWTKGHPMATSYSRLKVAFEASWEHYKHNIENPPQVGAAAHFGRMLSRFLLEGKTDWDDWHLEPDLNLRTKDGKESFDLWAQMLPREAMVVARFHASSWMIERLNRNDVTIVTHDDFERAFKISERVRARDFWKWVSDGAVFEQSGEFEFDDVLFRFKPDIRNPAKRVIADLKSARSVSPEAMFRAVMERMYDLQAAIYCTGSEIIDGFPYDYYLIGVESEAPFTVQEFKVPDHVMQVAWDAVRKKVKEFKQCSMLDHWPGVSEKPLELYWPDWAINKREMITNDNQQ